MFAPNPNSFVALTLFLFDDPLVADTILIHYQKHNGVVVLVVAEDEAGRRMPFGFLNELHNRFTAKFSAEEIGDAVAYGMASWGEEIGKLMVSSPFEILSLSLRAGDRD